MKDMNRQNWLVCINTKKFNESYDPFYEDSEIIAIFANSDDAVFFRDKFNREDNEGYEAYLSKSFPVYNIGDVLCPLDEQCRKHPKNVGDGLIDFYYNLDNGENDI